MAQSLFSTKDRDFRNYLEDYLLLERPQEDLFLNFRPTSFERPRLYWLESPRTRYLAEAGPLSEGSYASTSLAYAGFYEEQRTYPAIGTEEYPVDVSSFRQRSQGLPVREGRNFWAEFEVGLRPADWLFLHAAAQTGGVIRRPEAESTHAQWRQLEKLYAEFRINQMIISLGRKPLYWGTAETSALLISDNARSFDGIQISTLPQRWPGIFKHLGAMKAELFWAVMEENRDPGRDHLVGWRLGLQPFDRFETGVSMVYQFGGYDIEKTNWLDIFFEILGGRGNHGPGEHDSSMNTNRAAIWDLRFYLRDWAWPTSFYAEHHLEDCCGSLEDVFVKSFSYLYGIRTRTSNSASGHRFRLEYAKTGHAIYRHSKWRSGFTRFGEIVGHPIGRDAHGLYFQWEHFFDSYDVELRADLFFEERIRLEKVVKKDIRDSINFERSEKRSGSVLRFQKPLGFNWFLNLSGGLYRVLNWDFQAGDNRWMWGLHTQFEYAF